MDTKVPYVQKWTQGIKDQCAGDMEDTLNPRIDGDQVDWQQSAEHCFIRDVVADTANLLRIFLYKHYDDAEICGDDAKRWLIARFSDDAFFLRLFLKYEEEKDIVLIAAMRMFALLERMPSSQKTSFFADLFFGLRRLGDEQLNLFFRFLYGDDEERVQSIRNALRNYKLSEFERLITLSFKQQS